MPTLEELQASMAATGASQEERNQQIAQAVQAGQIGQSLGYEPMAHQGPERTPAENRAVFEGHQQELTDEEVAARMTPTQEEQDRQALNIVQRMAENYQTSPQYRELLDQELMQISAQIAELTQRRNMIEMARRGQA